jgi:hypothetical protein
MVILSDKTWQEGRGREKQGGAGRGRERQGEAGRRQGIGIRD